MKSILLTTSALVAFAGAAAAEVSFSGEATLGYNSRIAGDNDGFYWDANVATAMSQELDNGVTAAASFQFDAIDNDNETDIISESYVLSLTTESAGMYYGDTAFAAETLWKSAGDMESDGFSEADGETVLRGEASFGAVEAAVSYTVADADNNFPTDDSHVDQLSVAAAGDFGQFSVVAAYQEESEAAFGVLANGANGDYNTSEIFGLSVGASFSGADITVAYASDETLDESSVGVQVAYPFGPVTATVYYVSEDDAADEDNYGVTLAYSEGALSVKGDYDYDQGVNKIGLDGSYDLGNGLTILAGVYDQSDDATDANNGTDAYIAGEYDLGGGASILVSYAEAETGGAKADDEVGGPDYQDGATVELTFAF
ncbi:porin [Yoonia maritima]|uniref:porin n=1 Tax=Yoonia maritima TaxID=1435347 RepID=UPI000D113128|nr:porin [Yoonia maritima]